MAHLRLQQESHSSQPAIFSPSVARAAASTAKDWAYVDAWLKSKYSANNGSGVVPSFERNPDTLRSLLALVAANEAADEQRDQLARIEDAALDQVRSTTAAQDTARQLRDNDLDNNNNNNNTTPPDGALIAHDLLNALEDNLTKEGRTALDAIAGMAVELDLHSSTSASSTQDSTTQLLAERFIALQSSATQIDHALSRVELLSEYIRRESERFVTVVQSLQSTPSANRNNIDSTGSVYQPSPLLPAQNSDLSRKVKTLTSQIPQLEQQVEALNKISSMPTVTVDTVKDDEDEYLRVLARKKRLDAQVKAFAGLPPDVEAARIELEHLREELAHLTDRRDNNFERLVERESPAKPRRRM